MDDKELSALKALAEAASLNDWPFHGIAFQKAANPAAILSLISRVEQAEAASTERANNAIDQTILSMRENITASPALGGENFSLIKIAHHLISDEPKDCDEQFLAGRAYGITEMFSEIEKQSVVATCTKDAVSSDAWQMSFDERGDLLLNRGGSQLRFVPATSTLRDLDTENAAIHYQHAEGAKRLEVIEAELAEERQRQAQGEPVAMLSGALNHARDALRFYAEQQHFHMHQPDEWDTVSGEPQNLYEDSAHTATAEDGSIAKQALENIAHVERYAALATSPAPSVKQEVRLAGFQYRPDLGIRAVLYTDSINGTQVCRDDLWLATTDDLNALAVAAPSASQGEVKVPEGFALVPKDPTPEMVHAARFYSGELPTTAATCYRAMIAAAPAPSVMDGEKK